MSHDMDEKLTEALRVAEELRLQLRTDYRLIHDALLWAHEDHMVPLPAPGRAVVELVNAHQRLLVERECWRILASTDGGVGNNFSQRQAVERGDMAACREWAKKNEAYIEDLQKQAYSVREKVEAAVRATIEACAESFDIVRKDGRRVATKASVTVKRMDPAPIVARVLGGGK